MGGKHWNMFISTGLEQYISSYCKISSACKASISKTRQSYEKHRIRISETAILVYKMAISEIRLSSITTDTRILARSDTEKAESLSEYLVVTVAACLWTLLLQHLKTYKSSELNDIYTRIIKAPSDVIAEHIAILFDMSVRQSRLPAERRDLVSNYRPFSFTNAAVKLIKKEDWAGAKDRNIPVDVIYIDLNNVFYKVSHPGFKFNLEPKSSVLLFADDTQGMSDSMVIQDDLNSLMALIDGWLLEVNSNKSVMVRLSNYDDWHHYTICGYALPRVRNYKESRVIPSSDLKTTSHCKADTAISYELLRSIRRSLHPCFKCEGDMLKGVQRRGTKVVKGLFNLSYEDRLSHLNLFPLPYRRICGDIILAYPILNDDPGINMPCLFVPTRTDHLGGHSKTVQKPGTNRLRLEFRFSHRVVNYLNSLPEHIVSVPSCEKSNCQRLGCRYSVESGMQCEECKGWYHEVCTNLTPVAFKRLLASAVGTPNSNRSFDTQIGVKQTQMSSEKVPSVPRLLNGIQQETPKSRNRKARSVSSGKHNLTFQIVDNPPESHSIFDATVVASHSNVNEWAQVVRKKQHNDIKGSPAPIKVVEKSKADYSDRSVIFHTINENESSEPKTRFGHNIVLIKQLLNQLMPQNTLGVTLLKVYRLDSLANLKPNLSRLLKVAFKSSNERNLILQNPHELKGSVVFIRKDLSLADHVKRREAEKLQIRLDAGEKDIKIVNFWVYRKARNTCASTLRKSRNLYEEKIVKESIECPKHLYSYINQRTKIRGNIPAIWGDSTAASLVEDDFGKSTGPDKWHPRLLKELCNSVANPLSICFNLSIMQDRLPKDWRNAIVSPVFKTGTKYKPENYRPVGLISVVIKILEKTIHKELFRYLDENRILSEKQHVARESWCPFKDQTLPVDVAYIDFSKALDNVPHNRLLYKLRNIGIGGNLLMWIKYFLVGRQQRVRVNSKLSSWETVLSGVPQGTVLGPVLFLLYVNDLPRFLSSSVLLYAENVKIWRTIRCKGDSSELLNDMKKLAEWSQTWQLPINTSECVVMHIGHQGTDTYTINNTELPVVQTHNDLGVIVSQDLKTTAHCRAIATKGFRTLWSIRRVFSHVDAKTFLTLYTVFVRPKLEYCIQAASPCLKKDSELLEKVQKTATKLIPGIAKLPYESRLANLNLSPLSYRRTRGDLITVFKLLSDKFAPNMPSFFLSSETENLREHSEKVHKPRTNYLSADYRLSHRIINEWNSLPQHVVEAPSVDSFRRNVCRANLALVTLKRICGQSDSRTLSIIFNSFTRLYLEYGSIVFPPSLQKDKDTLERIER
ncbi:hypothetical protein MS3_00004352 [Schistosoma haematobium]|uniref:Uncharacterized protein n=1 Tax=Schistosoma haematobium TaxID=6185 RepID=A0A6A5DEP3_SCHHA|nr:hypothetical protein MS3_00004352 [Schistosoma haematobium]KAH9592422.1 hypothetical protein MS3_00004352 [Schistosoma haematobium]